MSMPVRELDVRYSSVVRVNLKHLCAQLTLPKGGLSELQGLDGRGYGQGSLSILCFVSHSMIFFFFF